VRRNKRSAGFTGSIATVGQQVRVRSRFGPIMVTVTPDAALAATAALRTAERLELVTPEIVPRIVVPLDAATVVGAAALGAVGDAL